MSDRHEFPGLDPLITNSLPEHMARAMRETGTQQWDIGLFETFCRRYNAEMALLFQEFGPAVEALRMEEGEQD